MSRKRMIDPEFWLDEKVASLSLGARLLFIGMWNFADDEGLTRFNSSFLKTSIFGYDDTDLKTIEKWMNELVEKEMVFKYIGGITKQYYAYIINFRKHQVINRPQPSKTPPPSLQSNQVARMYAERDNFICHLCGDKVALTGRSDLPDSKMYSLDHLIPRSNGGSDYPTNIKIAHISCNKSRGNRSLSNSVNGSRLIESNISEVNRKEVNEVKLNKESAALKKMRDQFGKKHSI